MMLEISILVGVRPVEDFWVLGHVLFLDVGASYMDVFIV